MLQLVVPLYYSNIPLRVRKGLGQYVDWLVTLDRMQPQVFVGGERVERAPLNSHVSSLL